MQPQTDTLYQSYDKSLYRITGSETEDSILNMLNANPSADNSGMVNIPPDSIGSGVSTSTTIDAVGSTLSGKTGFNNTQTGYILGLDKGVAKFYIGNTTNYLNWDGTTLSVSGAFTASSGVIGGWSIGATTLTGGNAVLDSSGILTLGTANNVVVLSAADATYRLWIGNASAASAPFTVTKAGAVAASNMTITGGSVATTVLNKGVQGWSTNIVFSSASDTQINWTSGSIVTEDGTTYSISSGNTGAMAALTYIYLDIAVSATVLQTTSTYSTATGDGKILIATAQNNTAGASVIPLGGSQPIINGTAQITALSITAASIAASTITAAKLTVSQLSAISADMGSITAGTIVLSSGGLIRSGQTDYDTGTGWWVGNASGTPKLSIGNSAGNKLTWDGTSMTIVGTVDASSLVNAPIVANYTPIQTVAQNDAVFLNNDAVAFTPAIRTNDNLNIGDVSGNTRGAQSFTEGFGYIFDKLRVFLAKVATPIDNMTFAIQADSAGAPSGVDLATATVTPASLTTSPAEYELALSVPVLTVANTKYWIVARRTGSVDGTNFYRWYGKQTSVYANGAFATYNGSSWSNQTWDAHFKLLYSVAQSSTVFDPSISILVGQNWGTITSLTRVAQSFTESAVYTYDQVDVWMCLNGAPVDTVTLTIESDSADAPSGTILATGTVLATSITRNDGGSVGERITFRLDKVLTSVSSTKYWIVLKRSGAVDASNYFVVFGSASSAYANGKYSTYNPTTWTNSATVDMQFKLCLSSSTPALRQTNASLSGYYEAFLGFVKTATNAGTSCPVIISGQVTTFTNLVSNKGQYYLSDTAGQISTTAGTNTRKVGISTSMTKLLITNIW